MEAFDFETGDYSEEEGVELKLDCTKPLCVSYVISGKKKPLFWDFTKGDKIEDFIEFLFDRIEKEAKRGKNPEIWSFSNYDVTILLNYYYRTLKEKGIMRGGEEDKIKRICYKPLIFTIKSKNGKNEGRLLDAQGFFSGNLAMLGNMVKMPKLEKKMKCNSVNDLKEYCIRDAEIVVKAMENLRVMLKREFDYIPKRLSTLPKLAYNLLMKICLNSYYCKDCGNSKSFKIEKEGKKDIAICKECSGKGYRKGGWWWFCGKTPFILEPELTHKSSRGGRFECFAEPNKVIKDNIYKLDITSQYPYVCLQNELPDIRRGKVHEYPNLDILDDKVNYPIGIVRAEVEAPECNIGYLPIRYKSTIYPNRKCKMYGVWTLFEIRRAREEGYKINFIEKAIIYPKLPFNMFEDFFNKLFELKRNAKDPITRLMVKKLMNSVTGRFGYRRGDRDEVEVKLIDFEKFKSKGYNAIRDKGDGNIIMSKTTDKVYSSSSAGVVLSHITAWARDMLYKKMKELPFEDLLYVSTDAITFKGKNNLKYFNISEKLGDWKIEDYGTEAEFWNEQYYRIGENIKASGVRKTDVTLEAIREGKIETTAMLSMKVSWKKGEFENMGTFEDKILNLSKVPKRWRPYPNFIMESLDSELLFGVELAKKMRETPTI